MRLTKNKNTTMLLAGIALATGIQSANAQSEVSVICAEPSYMSSIFTEPFYSDSGFS